MNIHGVNERQMRIVEILKREKFCTAKDLQEVFGVTTRTIRYDMAYLKKVYKDNIVCHRGGHGGGIEWVDR